MRYPETVEKIGPGRFKALCGVCGRRIVCRTSAMAWGWLRGHKVSEHGS